MNYLSVELVWTKIQMGMTILGGWLGYFLGGMDGLLVARARSGADDLDDAAQKIVNAVRGGK